jgi:hypothetical protein
MMCCLRQAAVTTGIPTPEDSSCFARTVSDKGDVVEIPPDVVHWHGAAPDTAFSHIGISPNTQKGPAAWLGAVTDEEYLSATKK